MIGGGIRKFVYNMDRSGFLEREIIGFGVDRYQ
jgi:hypothetical protein